MSGTEEKAKKVEKAEVGDETKTDEEGKTELETIVEDKIAEKVEAIPDEEPVADGQRGYIDQRLTEMENRMAAMFVQMGGTINTGAGNDEPNIEPEPYRPLDQLDYKI